MAKKRLLDNIEFTTDQWSLIEIVNPCENYQFAYYINEAFEIDLEREDDFDFAIQNDEIELFPIYTYTDEELKRFYVLLCTHSENDVALWKDFDSSHTKLLFIFGNEHQEAARHLESFVMDIPNTIYAQYLNFAEQSNSTAKPSKNEKRKQRLEKLFNDELLEALELHFSEIEEKEEKQRKAILFQNEKS